METEDFISLPGGSGDSGGESESGEICGSDSGACRNDGEGGAMDGESLLDDGERGADECTRDGEASRPDDGDVGKEGEMVPQLREGDNVTGEEGLAPACLELNLGNIGSEEGEINGENMGALNEGANGAEEESQTEVDMDLVDSPPLQVNVEVADTVAVAHNLNCTDFTVNAEKVCVDFQNQNLIHRQTRASGSVSGVKRARMMKEEQQPSVHIAYNSLTSSSKQKLQELLQQWSEWHAQHSTLYQDSNEVLECGEETYFPALCVGMEKSSAVSFWIDNRTQKLQSDGFVPVESDSVPLYDRAYALGLTLADGPSNVEGGLEIVDDAPRCFNCGSYSHAFKECPKPRDNVAVNNARRQHKSKRGQSSGGRNPTRYYQNTSGGKYDGLKPGALHNETRQLLGLGELDPPPWLNRMRELGYPPGYLDPDDEDQPSGIIIFGDEDAKEEQEDGEIIEKVSHEPKRKIAVEFPGINAPIPENADERRWAAPPSCSDPPRSRLHHRLDHSSETVGRRHNHEQRWSRDSLDDGPPGVDSSFSTSYPPRYGSYASNYASDSPRGPTSSLSRSHSERGRSSVVYEDYVTHSSSYYSSSSNHTSPRDNGSARYVNDPYERWDDHRRDYSGRSNDEYDRYHHRSRR